MSYNALEPGPYWPETGHAHTTCNAAAVEFGSVALRETRVFRSNSEEMGGMTSSGGPFAIDGHRRTRLCRFAKKDRSCTGLKDWQTLVQNEDVDQIVVQPVMDWVNHNSYTPNNKKQFSAGQDMSSAKK